MPNEFVGKEQSLIDNPHIKKGFLETCKSNLVMSPLSKIEMSPM